MRRAAIVSPLRTGVGKFLGSLSSVPAEDLAAAIIRAVVDKSGVDPDRIDDVSFAQSYANSEAPCIGRWAALAADLPLEVPGFQQDRRRGGGLQAIATADVVQTGAADVVVAGGVETSTSSTTPHRCAEALVPATSRCTTDSTVVGNGHNRSSGLGQYPE